MCVCMYIICMCVCMHTYEPIIRIQNERYDLLGAKGLSQAACDFF